MKRIKFKHKYCSKAVSISAFCAILLFAASCGKNYSPDEKAYLNKIEKIRLEKNDWMRNDTNSPFNFKGKVEFHNLKYFDADPEFVFKTKLILYSPLDTVTVMGTKGDERKMVRFGYFFINYQKEEFKVNFYEGSSRNGQKYYTLSFTDKTTNKETYGVGRYIELELNPDPDFLYEVDFNMAFNPYCAYSKNYSCSIPLKEDYIPLAINAGEKKFHD